MILGYGSVNDLLPLKPGRVPGSIIHARRQFTCIEQVVERILRWFYRPLQIEMTRLERCRFEYWVWRLADVIRVDCIDQTIVRNSEAWYAAGYGYMLVCEMVAFDWRHVRLNAKGIMTHAFN
jgi:hypothetical protein